MKMTHKRLAGVLFMALLLIVTGITPVTAQSARSRGMGGAFLGVSDDESATTYNPAGLSQIQGREAAVQAKVNERDLFNWNSVTFTGHIYEDNPKENFSVTDYLEHNVLEEPLPRRPKYSYGVDYTQDTRYPDFGKLAGGDFIGVKKQVDDIHLSFGTRFPIARRMLAREQLYAGLKFQFTNVDRWIKTLNTHASRDTQAMGFGLMYHYNDRITGGLTVDNLLERVTGADSVHDGATLNMGASMKLTKGTTVSADMVNVTNSSNSTQQQYRVGLEKKFIENDFTVRMGAWNGTLTLGFGLTLLPNLRFDYAYYTGDIVKEHYVGSHYTFD
ncbi:MAG: type IX secretion system membrane protein PorP/SprF [Candidatus Riflebacteria bacterium]|nr:type IX secretion system membrane protein PorP/SprF [Candidatus Riflebacteria bacterium]